MLWCWPGLAAASETWQFVDGQGVLHLGNTGAGQTQAKAVDEGVPDYVAERGWKWINHTWRLRLPEQEPALPGVAATGLALAAPGGPSRVGQAALKWPRGLDAVKPYLEQAARQHAVDPALVIAVAAAESAFNVDAVSHKGALGLMQIMPTTAARYGVAAPAAAHQRHAVLEPSVNAWVGSRYLSDLLRRYGGDKTLALAAYNAGEGAVAKYGNRVPPYRETQQYVDKVLRYYEALTP